MLLKNEVRGHHATGVAAVGGDRPFLLKRAVEASKFVKSALYQETMQGLAENTPILLGHTRHASHSNGHLDEAAHPFQDGAIIGTHNGVIYNWREIEAKLRDAEKTPAETPHWINDSQAPFALLDRIKDPVKALDTIDGWFALAWTRGKTLYFARTQIELSAAYVGSLRTLFWSSDAAVLRSTLDAAGITGYDQWLFNKNTVYQYNPMKFDAKSANGTKRDAPFRGITMSSRYRPVNGARPTELLGGLPGGYSTTRTYPSGRSWDSRSAREVDAPTEPKPTKGMKRAESDMDRVWDMVSILNTKILTLRAEVDVLRAENEHIYKLLNEKRPEIFEVNAATCCEPDETDENDGDVDRCVECGRVDAKPKLTLPDGTFIHEGCIFQGLGQDLK